MLTMVIFGAFYLLFRATLILSSYAILYMHVTCSYYIFYFEFGSLSDFITLLCGSFSLAQVRQHFIEPPFI